MITSPLNPPIYFDPGSLAVSIGWFGGELLQVGTYGFGGGSPLDELIIEDLFNSLDASQIGAPTASSGLLGAVKKGVSMAGHVIPAPCGGGGLAYFGNSKLNVLFQYDTSSGFGSGGLLEHQFGKVGSGGAAATTSGPEAFLWLGEGSGVLVAPSTTPSVGAFVGGKMPGTGGLEGGVGAYVTFESAWACH